MDGIEMAQAAAAAFPSLRILLMTGYADQRERAEELDGIVLDVMQKPFTLAEIRDRVGRALAFAAPAGGLTPATAKKRARRRCRRTGTSEDSLACCRHSGSAMGISLSPPV